MDHSDLENILPGGTRADISLASVLLTAGGPVTGLCAGAVLHWSIT